MDRAKADRRGKPGAQHNPRIADRFNHDLLNRRFVELQRTIVGVGEVGVGLHHAGHDEVTAAIDDLCVTVERWAAVPGARVHDVTVGKHHAGIATEVISVAVKQSNIIKYYHGNLSKRLAFWERRSASALSASGVSNPPKLVPNTNLSAWA